MNRFCAGGWALTFVVVALRASIAAADPISVTLDQARLMKLPDKVATVVVGNPLVADVTLQPGGMLVITGKSYGTTNLVVLDKGGAPLLDRLILVQGPQANTMVVFRGVERETYSCAPNCERRITLGDSAKFFEPALTQTGAFNSLASRPNEVSASSR